MASYAPQKRSAYIRSLSRRFSESTRVFHHPNSLHHSMKEGPVPAPSERCSARYAVCSILTAYMLRCMSRATGVFRSKAAAIAVTSVNVAVSGMTASSASNQPLRSIVPTSMRSSGRTSGRVGHSGTFGPPGTCVATSSDSATSLRHSAADCPLGFHAPTARRCAS